MCGIFAYKGTKQAAPILLNGLKRLEYRGYDSWGIAVEKNNEISVMKNAGKISEIHNLESLPEANIGIAHTRWATHGGITQNNAHPHYSTDKSFVLAQNGIVQNYELLKEQLLKKGYQFNTETDTEVIVRLVEDKLKENMTLREAIRTAMLDLEGRNTVIVLTTKGEIYAARNGSPLVIGLNDNNEIFISSDTLSFAQYANKIIVVENGQLVELIENNIVLYSIQLGEQIEYHTDDLHLQTDEFDKQGFPHYMIKEIHDTPTVIKVLTDQEEKPYLELADAIKTAKTVYTIGSGTAGAAAGQIAYYLREYSKINAISLIGADAQEYFPLFTKDDIIIAPSQSGETADVLEVLEVAKTKGIKIASYVNMPGSIMTRMSDFKFMAQAGPEVSVLSTKIFSSQLAWGYLTAKTISGQHAQGKAHLLTLSQNIQEYLQQESNHEQVKVLAEKLKDIHDIFLLGKSQNFLIIKEGMVKLIECTYKHAHAMPAGDLKHYAITLMQPGTHVVVALSNDKARSDVINAINEVKARGATVIGLAPQRHISFDYFIQVPDTQETSAIMNVIPLQLLAYYIGVELGNDIDKPRNIAKSVTVK